MPRLEVEPRPNDVQLKQYGAVFSEISVKNDSNLRTDGDIHKTD